MSKVRVAGFSVSLDGFSAGIEQSLSDQWFFHDDFADRAMDNFGAFILGRNMFGPVRGAWPDTSWKGWWGDNPRRKPRAVRM